MATSCHDADMGLRHGHQAGAGAAAELEIELMKRHALYEVAARFRFKAGERFVAELLVDGPVFVADGFEQLLIEL